MMNNESKRYRTKRIIDALGARSSVADKIAVLQGTEYKHVEQILISLVRASNLANYYRGINESIAGKNPSKVKAMNIMRYEGVDSEGIEYYRNNKKKVDLKGDIKKKKKRNRKIGVQLNINPYVTISLDYLTINRLNLIIVDQLRLMSYLKDISNIKPGVAGSRGIVPAKSSQRFVNFVRLLVGIYNKMDKNRLKNKDMTEDLILSGKILSQSKDNRKFSLFLDYVVGDNTIMQHIAKSGAMSDNITLKLIALIFRINNKYIEDLDGDDKTQNIYKTQYKLSALKEFILSLVNYGETGSDTRKVYGYLDDVLSGRMIENLDYDLFIGSSDELSYLSKMNLGSKVIETLLSVYKNRLIDTTADPKFSSATAGGRNVAGYHLTVTRTNPELGKKSIYTYTYKFKQNYRVTINPKTGKLYTASDGVSAKMKPHTTPTAAAVLRVIPGTHIKNFDTLEALNKYLVDNNTDLKTVYVSVLQNDAVFVSMKYRTRYEYTYSLFRRTQGVAKENPSVDDVSDEEYVNILKVKSILRLISDVSVPDFIKEEEYVPLKISLNSGKTAYRVTSSTPVPLYELVSRFDDMSEQQFEDTVTKDYEKSIETFNSLDKYTGLEFLEFIQGEDNSTLITRVQTKISNESAKEAKRRFRINNEDFVNDTSAEYFEEIDIQLGDEE